MRKVNQRGADAGPMSTGTLLQCLGAINPVLSPRTPCGRMGILPRVHSNSCAGHGRCGYLIGSQSEAQRGNAVMYRRSALLLSCEQGMRYDVTTASSSSQCRGQRCSVDPWKCWPALELINAMQGNPYNGRKVAKDLHRRWDCFEYSHMYGCQC